jgi:hypothetical protein
MLGIAFTLYNGFLGLYYRSIWNGTICVYYILLSTVRGIIVCAQKRRWSGQISSHCMVDRVTHGILFVMNASLIVPILAMIRGERHYNWGLIPAIAIASYTFYRIVMAIVRYAKTRKEEHSLMKQLGTFRLIDSLVALLTLQNTMIIVQEGAIAGEMQTFSIRSSILIWLVIVGVSVRSFRCP